MLTFEQMMARLVVAILLGALLGVEREVVGRGAAGVRTEILVSGGASLFAMIALSLPYITAAMNGTPLDAAAINGAFAIIANIVVGIGFLGAGLIVKTDDHPRGITTAALVWATAAIGIMTGIGMFKMAASSAILIAILLYALRRLSIPDTLDRPEIKEER